jgi:hypothetical protein
VCCGGLATALQAARLRGPTNKVRVAMRAMSPKIMDWLAVDAQKLTASKHANALMQFPHNPGGRARGYSTKVCTADVRAAQVPCFGLRLGTSWSCDPSSSKQ